MTSRTSKELHERTGALSDQVKQGQRFRVMRGGKPDALLVPATDQIDPPWDEIMAEVRKARAQGKPSRPNPILAERKKRNYAARRTLPRHDDCSVDEFWTCDLAQRDWQRPSASRSGCSS